MDHRHNRYAFLDGIRGMAAIFVLTRHTNDLWHISFFRSYLAVDLFFVLSGFVIAYAYDEKLRSGSISVPKFLLIRLIRLYPVYFLSLLLCVLIVIGKAIHHNQLHIEDVQEIMSVFTTTAFFIPSHSAGSNELFTINAPYWSLLFELIINIIYAIIRPFLTDLFLALILLISAMTLVVVSFHEGTLNVGFSWGIWSLVAGFSRSIFGIFLGLLIYRHHTFLNTMLIKTKSISPWFSFIVIAVILASPNLDQLNKFIDILSVSVFFPICILVASQGAVTKFQRLLLILGITSYPMYVLHIPLGELFSYVIQGRIDVYTPGSGIIFVIFLIAFSMWIEKWYDIPLRSWLSDNIIRRPMD